MIKKQAAVQNKKTPTKDILRSRLSQPCDDPRTQLWGRAGREMVDQGSPQGNLAHGKCTVGFGGFRDLK